MYGEREQRSTANKLFGKVVWKELPVDKASSQWIISSGKNTFQNHGSDSKGLVVAKNVRKKKEKWGEKYQYSK